jgi:hypothetical protein
MKYLKLFVLLLGLFCVSGFAQEVKPGFMRQKEDLFIYCFGNSEYERVYKMLFTELNQKFEIINSSLDNVQMNKRKDLEKYETFKRFARQKGAEKAILVKTHSWRTKGKKYKWHIVYAHFFDIPRNRVLYTFRGGKVGELIFETRKLFPSQARIVEKNDEMVVLDGGINFGIKSNTRYDVFSGNQKIGLIETKRVYNDYAEAKVKRGGSDIRPGNAVSEKPGFRSSIFLSHQRFPFDIVPNTNYIETSGNYPQKVASGGSYTKIGGYYLHRNKKSGIEGSIGFSNVSEWGGLGFDFNYFILQEIMPEFLTLKLNAGAGFGVTTAEQNWERPEDDYDDAIDRNSGKAEPTITINYQISAGLHFFLSPVVSVYANYGYLGILGYDNWKDIEHEESGDDEYFEVKEEWLEYKLNKIGGMAFEIGICHWMTFKLW